MGVLAWSAVAAHQAYLSHPRSAWPTIKATLAWMPVAASHAPRNIGTALLVLAICGLMAGPGLLILRLLGVTPRGPWERWAFAISVGLAGWVPVVLFFGWAVGLSRFDIFLPTAIYVSPSLIYAFRWLAHLRERARRPSTILDSLRHRWVSVVLIVIGVALLYLSLLGALSPEIEFDARWYHLGAAFHYAEVGHFYNLVAASHDPAMGLNPYQEILYTGFVSLIGVQAAKIFAFVDLALLFVAIVAFSRAHLNSTKIGLFAGLAFLSIPIVSWSGATAYNDLPVALYTLLAVHAVLRWIKEPSRWGWAYVSVGMAAFSFGVKAFGGFTLFLVGIAIVLTVLSQPTLRKVASFRHLAICVAVICATCAPWWIRDGAMTGNPVFPLANQLFHSPYWNSYAASAQGYANRHVSLLRLPLGLPESLWSTVSNPAPYNTLVGPFFLIGVPVALLLAICTRARPSPIVLFLAGFTLLWSGAWYLSAVSDSRYLLGVAPLACLAIAKVVADAYAHPRFTLILPVVSTLVLVVVGISTLQPFVPLEKVTTPDAVLGSVTYEWDYLYRGEPQFDVQMRFIPIANYINSHLNARSTKIYDDAGLNSIYLYINPELFTGSGYGSPTVMRQWSLSSPDAYQEFVANHVTDVVVMTADLKKVLSEPIGRHLQVLHHSPDGFVLLRVVP